MGMVEVGFQLRDSAEVMVASQELEYGSDGWPYGKVMAGLVANPRMEPKELGHLIDKELIDSNTHRMPATLSACDLTKVDDLCAAVDELAKRMIEHLDDFKVRMAILQARGHVQHFDPEESTQQYIDLYHFCQLLEAICESGDIRQSCLKVMEVIYDNSFVLSEGHTGFEVEHAHGASIYFPVRWVEPTYKLTDFSGHTHWRDFLLAYVRSYGWRSFLRDYTSKPCWLEWKTARELASSR
jgi:hypothetical protein